MNRPIKILVVDDSEDDAALAERALRNGGFDAIYRRVSTAADLKNVPTDECWNGILSDFKMSGCSGMDWLKILRDASADVLFIFISGAIGKETTVAFLTAGAGKAS